MNKKETIGSIDSIEVLSQLVIDLCQNSGLIECKNLSGATISAVEKAALKKKSHKIIITLSELNGKVPQILEQIKKYTSDSDDITIITTNQKVSDYFKFWLIEQAETNKIDFINQDGLIDKIDEYLPTYWGHSDLFLKSYEDRFILNVQKEVELKKLLKLDPKFESLLNIFIEPKIYIFKEEKETGRTIKTKISFDKLLKKENYIISGDAGTGKSTLLKQIGKHIIDNNHNRVEKTIPIIIRSSDLKECSFSILNTTKSLLSQEFAEQGIAKVFKEYHLLLLIDSIDEFEKENQKIVLESLGLIDKEISYNFILCTRNYDNLIDGCSVCKHSRTFLSNFDQRQVKLYLDNFFKFDLVKSNKLWENIIENKLLDRIPVTPLTISLISILYEEKQYEVPATLSDVYDNFNQFLLGRSTVKNRLEFLDINIKERLLSVYALDIIKSSNRQRKTKSEFIDFVKDFFLMKSISINEDLIPELLNSLTDGTSILFLDDKGFISFKHDHFMEYYASREIFMRHNRTELENELIEKFTEYNWQNTAIFYSGRTKDMPEFLMNLIHRVKQYSSINDYLLAISGMGYLLQSLWMTDSKIRKDGIVVALELLVRAFTRIKELAGEKFYFFKNIRDIDIAFLNLFWFYNHFNSIAIKDPLILAFDDLFSKLQIMQSTVFEKDKKTLLYELFCIAATLDHGRNSDSSKLEQLFDEHGILNDPFFVLLFEQSSNVFDLSNSKRLKEENKVKNKIVKYKDGIRFYLSTSAEDLRFTTFDTLVPFKKYCIYTEGKTDAIILFHAFSVLTGYVEPYWGISSLDKLKKDSGGADELRKFIENCGKSISTDTDSEKEVIGIFDDDTKGNQEFAGLDNNEFEVIHPKLKKHYSKKVYAILLSIPQNEEYDPYRQDKPNFKFFSIEHYFSKDILLEHKMIRETALKGVFEITGDKAIFANYITKINDIEVFTNFVPLFRTIDELFKRSIEYIE